MRALPIVLILAGGLALQPASAGLFGHDQRDERRQQRDERQEQRQDQRQAQRYAPPLRQQGPPQYQPRPYQPFQRGPEPQFGRPGNEFSPGDAARRAQEMNGGGRILSVDPNGPGYRVKVLKEGEVRVFAVPGG